MENANYLRFSLSLTQLQDIALMAEEGDEKNGREGEWALDSDGDLEGSSLVSEVGWLLWSQHL
jgi:hypothetical protein